VDPIDAPSVPEKIRIEFKAGVPVKVVNHQDGTVKTGALDLFLYLNEVGTAVGVQAQRQNLGGLRRGSLELARV
jgi:argininosuccinate synthase